MCHLAYGVVSLPDEFFPNLMEEGLRWGQLYAPYFFNSGKNRGWLGTVVPTFRVIVLYPISQTVTGGIIPLSGSSKKEF